jgi:hypothetical protein
MNNLGWLKHLLRLFNRFAHFGSSSSSRADARGLYLFLSRLADG